MTSLCTIKIRFCCSFCKSIYEAEVTEIDTLKTCQFCRNKYKISDIISDPDHSLKNSKSNYVYMIYLNDCTNNVKEDHAIFSCPQCGTKHIVRDSDIGKKGKCRKCNSIFYISSNRLPAETIIETSNESAINQDALRKGLIDSDNVKEKSDKLKSSDTDVCHTNKIKVEKSNLFHLFNGESFKIPSFQRDFSWKKNNVNDFWEDILEALENQQYYLGSFVFQKIGKENIIFDGQQRLTVMISFISILLNELKLIINLPDLNTSANNEFITNMESKFLFDEADNIYLKLGQSDQAFFKNCLQNPPISRQMQKNKSREFLLDYVFLNLRNKLKTEMQKEQTVENKIQFIKNIFNLLTTKIFFAVIYIEDTFKPETIFETLNYRGAPLNVSDLFKNILMAKAVRQNTKKEVEREWDKIREIAHNNRINLNEFMQNFWESLNGKILDRSLYKALKTDVEKCPKALEFINLMSESLELFADLIHPMRKKRWQNEKMIVDALYVINLTRTNNFYPLLLSLFSIDKKHINSDFKNDKIDLLNILKKLSIRLYICKSPQNIDLQKILTEYSQKIRNAKSEDINALVKLIKKEMPDNTSFEKAFSEFVSLKKEFTKFILFAIEKTLSGKSEPIDLAETNIEHIMPRSIEKVRGWKHVVNYHKKYLNRIGNLTLLSTKLNFTNGSFKRKQEKFYSDSNVILTRQLLEYNHWRKLEIYQRQKELAKYALKIW